MTEAEWLAGDDAQAMLAHLRSHGSGWTRRLLSWLRPRRQDDRERKARLFACACCRRIWPLLAAPRLREAVETAERFADGTASAAELAAARSAAADSPWGGAARAATATAWESAWAAAARAPADALRAVDWAAGDAGEALRAERGAQGGLVRDLFANPFRPYRPAPQAPWRADAGVLEEAWAIYQKHDFDALPRLAERLAAAGCRDAELLDHCRAPGPHARGCWALDLLMGKEGGPG
jgi:hypothetical protein